MNADKLRMDGSLSTLVEASLWERFKSKPPRDIIITTFAMQYAKDFFRAVVLANEPDAHGDESFRLKAVSWIEAAHGKFDSVMDSFEKMITSQMDNNSFDGTRNR